VIRTGWVLVNALLATAWHATGALLPTLWGSPRAAARCAHHNRAWSAWILRAAGVKVRIEGVENLPDNSAQVLVVNHESWFDVWALSAHLPVNFRFVAKKELGTIPIFGRAWKNCGHVSVDRSDNAAAIQSMDGAMTRLTTEALTLIMFPEGTRAAGPELLNFKKGAFVIAIQAQVPLIPVGLVGPREAMAKGEWRIRPGSIVIRIGRRIPVDGLSFADRDRLRDHARVAIDALRSGAPLESVGGAVPLGPGLQERTD